MPSVLRLAGTPRYKHVYHWLVDGSIPAYSTWVGQLNHCATWHPFKWHYSKYVVCLNNTFNFCSQVGPPHVGYPGYRVASCPAYRLANCPVWVNRTKDWRVEGVSDSERPVGECLYHWPAYLRMPTFQATVLRYLRVTAGHCTPQCLPVGPHSPHCRARQWALTRCLQSQTVC